MTETGASRAPWLRRRLVLGVVLAALGVLTCIALGVWQVERLGWKLSLIAAVDTRVHAAAVAAPGPMAWPSITADGDEYRRVTLTGQFRNADETLVQAVTDRGPGFWVMAPLIADAGFTVLVNRGFVPDDRRDPTARAAGEVAGETAVTGLLRVSEPGGGFLRSNDARGDRWYSRDVAAIAAARGLGSTAPYFIDADATPNPGGLPAGGLTVLDFPNNHLIYAVTWFVLAAMLAGAVLGIAGNEWRARRRAGLAAAGAASPAE